MASLQNFFSGLNTVMTPDDIKDTDTPDSRNDDISQPGALFTRPGMAKDNTTAKANGPIFALFTLQTEDDITKDIYIDSSGNVVTW